MMLPVQNSPAQC